MWRTVKLGEIYDVGSSKRVLKADWKAEGIPFYRGREITVLSADGFVDNDLFITEEQYQTLSAKSGVPSADDIMITAIGTIGNTYIVQPNHKFYFKDASVLWLKKVADVSSKYVQYWLKTDEFFSQLDKGNGATVDTLTIKKLASVAIPLPPLAEQKRIVEKLDAAFAEIDRGIEIVSDKQKQSEQLADTALDEIANLEGESVTLAQVCSIEAALVSPTETPYRHQKHIGAGNITSFSNQLIDVMTAEEEQLTSGKYPFNESSVLYSKIRPYLRKVHLPEFDGICSADMYPLVPDREKLTREFLFYLLLSNHFTNYAIAGSARAGMPKVNRNHLFAYKFSLPKIVAQTAFAENMGKILSQTRTLKGLYQSQIDGLTVLKSAMLAQELQPAQSEAA